MIWKNTVYGQNKHSEIHWICTQVVINAFSTTFSLFLLLVNVASCSQTLFIAMKAISVLYPVKVQNDFNPRVQSPDLENEPLLLLFLDTVNLKSFLKGEFRRTEAWWEETPPDQDLYLFWSSKDPSLYLISQQEHFQSVFHTGWKTKHPSWCFWDVFSDGSRRCRTFLLKRFTAFTLFDIFSKIKKKDRLLYLC